MAQGLEETNRKISTYNNKIWYVIELVPFLEPVWEEHCEGLDWSCE